MKLETFSYLPELSAGQLAQQVRSILGRRLLVGIEFSSAPEPRDHYWTMWKLPLFDTDDPAAVLTELDACRQANPGAYIKINGYDAARNLIRGGFRGCWVFALGTNDTADVAAGSNVGLATRINRMMQAAGGEPVMWVNVRSLLSSGPYAEANMLRWDQALLEACPKYPNMRVYNWAAEVRTKWYISDGIHFTSLGYKHRAQMIAEALARAFPATGHASGCLVSS